MKADRLLKFYEAGRRDFRDVSLIGEDLSGKDLSGADFRGADIRSANFANATLKGANFAQTTAGLRGRWVVCWVVVSYVLSIISGFFSGLASVSLVSIIRSNHLEQMGGWMSLVIIGVFFASIRRKGLGRVTGIIASASTVIFTVALVTGLTDPLGVPGFAIAFMGMLAVAFVGALAVLLTVTFAGKAAGQLAIGLALFITFIVTVLVAFADSVAAAFSDEHVASQFSFMVILVVGFAIAATLMLLSAHIGWRALEGDAREGWIRSIAVACAAMGSTSFRGADLTHADFSQAQLKGTDFRSALLVHTQWEDAEALDWAKWKD
ncbi:MAG: pentapeptide repeat-containing protein [Cyanobacteria bacterium P01_D01_bin.6]